MFQRTIRLARADKDGSTAYTDPMNQPTDPRKPQITCLMKRDSTRRMRRRLQTKYLGQRDRFGSVVLSEDETIAIGSIRALLQSTRGIRRLKYHSKNLLMRITTS